MRHKITHRMVLLAALLGVSLSANAGTSIEHVFGWVEKARLEPWGVEIKAKLDTGALTSSLHARNVERFKKDGQSWVRFTVDVTDESNDKKVSREFEKPVYRDVVLRGAGGKDHRPVVVMKICMGGTIHEEQFSLGDRSDMIYPLLIGRRTIQHLGVVDVTRTFLSDPHCGKEAPVKKFNPDNSDEDIGA